jgi:hypothetical protein
MKARAPMAFLGAARDDEPRLQHGVVISAGSGQPSPTAFARLAHRRPLCRHHFLWLKAKGATRKRASRNSVRPMATCGDTFRERRAKRETGPTMFRFTESDRLREMGLGHL